MSREIVRDHGVMLLLGSMRAEERLAAFLLNLTQRLRARGFSASSLVLRMTREEIGSYLGLKLETVSRAFSKFQDDGLLEVKQRQIRGAGRRRRCRRWSTAAAAEPQANVALPLCLNPHGGRAGRSPALGALTGRPAARR